MSWSRPVLLTALLACLLGLPRAASAATPSRLLAPHRGNRAQFVPPPANALELAKRWQAVKSVDFMRGVHPGSARLRGHAAPAQRLFTAENPETIRVAALRIDFARDSVGTKTSGDGHFMLTPDPSVVVDPPPHDRRYFEAHMQALARYYLAQSYGTLVVKYDVYPRGDSATFRLHDMSDYGPWTLTQHVVDQATRLVRNTFEKADSSSENIPWSKYDRVIILHAGADFQSDVYGDSPYDLPTFTLGLTDSNVVTVRDKIAGQDVQFDAASMIPETASQDQLISAINGALAHEFGLLLGARGHAGLPDLYNVISGLPAIGTWDIMDSGNLLGTRIALGDTSEIYAVGVVPGPLSIWSKLQLFPDVMVGDTVLTAAHTLTLTQAEKEPGYGLIPLTQDEHLLLENRETDPDSALGGLRLQTDPATGVILGTARVRVAGTDTTVTQTNEYDVLQPASGVLCFHVDNSVLYFPGVNADTLYFGVNTQPARLGLGLIQADGSKSLGDGGSVYYQGGPYDPFFEGQINNRLNEDVRPDSRGNSGGLTGVSFEVPDPPGASMRVQVRRSRSLAGWPALELYYYDIFQGKPFYFLDGAPAVANLDSGAQPQIYAAGIQGNLLGVSLTGGNLSQAASPTNLRPFYNLRRAILPEVLTMPEWGPPGQDALLLEWDDSTRAEGEKVKLVAITGLGETLANFPPKAPSLTTPLARVQVQESYVALAGAADGRVWMFAHDGTATPLGDSLGVPVVGRLCVAPFRFPNQSIPGLYVAAAYSDGTIRFFALNAADKPRGRDAGPASVETPPTNPCPITSIPRLANPTLLAALADPADANSSDPLRAGPSLFVVDSTGAVYAGWPALATPSATAGQYASNVMLLECQRAGFPYTLQAFPAGPATLGSLRADGRPCILVQTEDALLNAIGMDGRQLPGFPARLPRGRALVPSAPPLEYRDPQGRPVVLVPTSSGDIAAVDSTGKPVAGWPRAAAASWGTGISWVKANVAGATRPLLLAIGLQGGWTLDSLANARVQDLVSYGAGVDEGRTGYLPVSRTLPAADASAYADLDHFRAYPNPLRWSALHEFRVGFDLRTAQPVRVRLYDLHGRIVSEVTWSGHVAGNVVALPAGDLGSGIYQCEVVARGSGVRKVTPVAVVR